MSLVDQLLQNAKKVSDQAQSRASEGGFGYRSVYITPTPGARLVVRLLVASTHPVMSHKYYIHRDESGQALCLWDESGSTCPVCEAVREVENSTGSTSKLSAKPRVIMYAQYVSSSKYDWSDKFPEPKVGDIILVMGPGGLYNLSSQFLLGFSDRPDVVSQFISDVAGQTVTLSRDKDNRVIMSPSMSNFTSAGSQEEFDSLLLSLKPLPQLVTDAHPFESNEATRTTMVQALSRRLSTPGVPYSAEGMANQGVQKVVQPPAPADGYQHQEYPSAVPETYAPAPQYAPQPVPLPTDGNYAYPPELGQDAPVQMNQPQAPVQPQQVPNQYGQPNVPQYDPNAGPQYNPNPVAPPPVAPATQPVNPQQWGAPDPQQVLNQSASTSQVPPAPVGQPQAQVAPGVPVPNYFGSGSGNQQ